jgi:hypothetical protein
MWAVWRTSHNWQRLQETASYLTTLCEHSRTKTTIETWPASTVTRKLYTTENVYAECAASHWAEQSVCSFDKNTISWIQKFQKRRCPSLLILIGPCLLSGLEHLRNFSIDREYTVVELEMFLHMPIFSWFRVMLYRNQVVCLTVSEGSVHSIFT